MAKKQQPKPAAAKRDARKGGAKQQGKQSVAAPKAPRRAKQPKAVDRVALFIREYLVDMNGRQAALRAGYGAERARQTAWELLSRPDVASAIDAALAERQKANAIDAELVLQRMKAIATADPRELIEVHRTCCRYCWGKDHLYQRTPREMREARHAHAQAMAEAIAKAQATEQPDPVCAPFDEEGGVGFNPYNDPNRACPECFGEGETRVVAKDTRDLSPTARLLYAGAKQTQHGIEVRMHDQVGANRDLGKYLGLFRDKVEVTGKDGGPVEHALTDVLAALDGAETGVGPAASRKR